MLWKEHVPQMEKVKLRQPVGGSLFPPVSAPAFYQFPPAIYFVFLLIAFEYGFYEGKGETVD